MMKNVQFSTGNVQQGFETSKFENKFPVETSLLNIENCRRLDFFAPGIPVSKGSKHAFYDKKSCRAWVVENNNAVQKAWASLVSTKAHEAMKGAAPSTLPVMIRVAFTFPRPGNHYGSGSNAAKLLPSAPNDKTTAPDVDKLARCILDALTGVVYRDDSQVVSLHAVKGFVGEHTPGATVCVTFGDSPRKPETIEDPLPGLELGG